MLSLSGEFSTKNFKKFSSLLILVEFFLILSFSALDLFLFYFAFESILLPTFSIVLLFGTRARKVLAAYYLFFYTLTGSLLMLAGVLYVQQISGTTSVLFLKLIFFSRHDQIVLFLLFFCAFASKIPMFPFHIWLPEAHVEAPTVGSVLLAALLLKLGGFGFLRYSIPLFPYASVELLPVLYTAALLGVFYPALTALRQSDFKRIIAYSSISHMNVAVLGIFSFSEQGVCGAVLVMIAHGITSSGLFILVGALYARWGARSVRHYGGARCRSFWPLGFAFAVQNIAFPGTGNFAGECLLLVGCVPALRAALFVLFAASSFGLVYTMALIGGLFNGASKKCTTVAGSGARGGLSYKEFFVLFSLLVANLYLGLNPNALLDLII